MSQEGQVLNAMLRQGILSWGTGEPWMIWELGSYVPRFRSWAVGSLKLCFLRRAHALRDQGENWACGERHGMAV